VDTTIRSFEAGDESNLIELWRQCNLLRTWNDPREDIARNQQSACGRILVAVHQQTLVGAVMIGYDGRRGWINYLAVAPGHRRRKLGTLLMSRAEAYLRELGCPKVNLQVRQSNLDVVSFYTALGYSDDLVVSLGKRL
jgi:ribosomal protein S18 acetylase RimI-like enzyme